MSCSLREMEGSQPMGTDVFQIVILAGKSSKFYFTTQTLRKRVFLEGCLVTGVAWGSDPSSSLPPWQSGT
jgi:hypothetical protein